MNIQVFNSAELLGVEAAKIAAQKIKDAINDHGSANIILATGTSQLNTLKNLLDHTDIQWGKVSMFHLDEYVALPETHIASFRKYLKEKFVNILPESLNEAYFIDGNAKSLEGECQRLNKMINQRPIDIALVGIGENGHLAFNDPPANFNTKEPFIVVDLDDKCKRQQVGEGWFSSLDEVPNQAISMSIYQIMMSKYIVCSVPGEVKAEAVKNCLSNENGVSNLYPASILKEHPHCEIMLDTASASSLNP